MRNQYQLKNRGQSPWSLAERLRRVAWDFCWLLFCRWTPKPLNSWRVLWVKLFGGRISKGVFIHQRAKILAPWRLEMRQESCLGDGANAYTLGQIILGARSVVAQEAYICTGTHDFRSKNMDLITEDIEIGEDSFIGARAFVLPGVNIGQCCVVGACSVVTSSVVDNQVVAGNPARVIKT